MLADKDSKGSQQARMMGQIHKEESYRDNFKAWHLDTKRTPPPEDKGYMVSKYRKVLVENKLKL